MVLLALAIGMVMTVLVGGFQRSSDSVAGGVTDAALRRMSDAMGDDIARAGTPDHVGQAVRDDVLFDTAVRTGAVAFKPARSVTGAVLVDAPPVPAVLADVVSATGTGFQVIVKDRCVDWRMVPPGPGSSTYDVVRTEYGPSCLGAPLEKRTYASAHADTPGLDATPFSYELVCHPTACNGASGADRARPCSPYRVDGPVTGAARAWIVGVQMRFTAVTETNRGSAGGTAVVSEAIRVRDVERYRAALGC